MVTARNEEKRLGQAMAVRLADDYPDLELILIDDRSTDATPAIVDRIAAADPRVRAVHITTLPEGWLGKLNALATGARACRGEWILFSDGDVFVRPGALRRVVGYAEANGLGHAAVFPEFYSTGLLLDAATTAFARTIAVIGRIWAVEDPASSAAVGSGGFNLVRARALRSSKGFEHLRMEVGDDLALGVLLKREGNRSAILNGRDYVGVRFYESLGAMARGTERAGRSTRTSSSRPACASGCHGAARRAGAGARPDRLSERVPGEKTGDELKDAQGGQRPCGDENEQIPSPWPEQPGRAEEDDRRREGDDHREIEREQQGDGLRRAPLPGAQGRRAEHQAPAQVGIGIQEIDRRRLRERAGSGPLLVGRARRTSRRAERAPTQVQQQQTARGLQHGHGGPGQTRRGRRA